MANAVDLPAELRELLHEDTAVVDVNKVLTKQRLIKKYKQEMARKKAG